MKKQEIFQAYQDFIMPTYTRSPVIFVKGKGMKLIDIDGRQYLDFFPGWGVGSLGHCHPKVVSAVRDQIDKLIHLPNNYLSTQAARLAKELIYWTFPGKVFLANSGAEANEAAIKLARAYGKGRYEIISFENSFHGRTLAALTMTGQKKYQEGFWPLPEGFKIVPFNDIKAVERALTEKSVAIIIELIQGEGGINVAASDFVLALRKLCDEKKLLLIVDEVQTGLGRTGKMFAYQHFGITPDVMTLAKALGGGLPIAAMLARREIADCLTPGSHASTFGGSPLVCKAALAVFRAIQKEKLLANAKEMGEYLKEKLTNLAAKYSLIKEIRGLGLMLGIQLNIEGKPIVEECLKNGLLINCTQERVLRLMPALNVNKKQVDKAIGILDRALSAVTSKPEGNACLPARQGAASE
ncbi:MAG: acetylornithine aminotransferase [Omnitrophica WOR_2 bacterium RIFCSPLOWO2_12_FULL_46_30]|nr:MAG: acetylornithine aminotransferase [Omnitrophica WOR_2 bacterium RIFCSPHIGHO2_02_FULL_46_37]OGX42392.1 MAG: acetylornithine aminotransferase [Omnitrophica WOR_2 bacterium RIFCSPLOWO2_02_FULL_45_28]OGX50370.1 MAG: acetylornithine aminotransferase [Omnitrophica WOR_2 bacterium RIFCSPLOWO2_12_FULL_46_30]